MYFQWRNIAGLGVVTGSLLVLGACVGGSASVSAQARSPDPDSQLADIAISAAPQAVPMSPPAALPTVGGVATNLRDAPSEATLPGWNQEDLFTALAAYAAGCGGAREARHKRLCDEANVLMQSGRTPSQARQFFEQNFVVRPVETADGSPGLLTSYFAPEYPARRLPDAEFNAPVRSAPQGWVRGQRLADRATIEAAAATDALAWMRAEDLFFMQIQGSGYLTFEDGGHARAAYAADNGHPFVGIARPMAERDLLPRNGTSGEAIRAWLADRRGPEAQAIMALNPRYIYFRIDPDDGGHPPGAAAIPLFPRRSIAVDPGYWTYGDLVWISADGGNLAGARSSYHGLVMALDTGSAIRGPVRADLYMGRGEAAGAEAGTVRHPLRMWRLVPR